jgi:hypothetical protein
MRLVGVRVLPVAMKEEKGNIQRRKGRMEPEAKALNSPSSPGWGGLSPAYEYRH